MSWKLFVGVLLGWCLARMARDGWKAWRRRRDFARLTPERRRRAERILRRWG